MSSAAACFGEDVTKGPVADRGLVLEGERVLLRSVRPEDVQPLCEILAEREVARWWGRLNADEVREQLVGPGGLTIEVDGAVAGFIQYEEEGDPMYRHAMIDIFLTSALHGRGHGTEAISLLSDYLTSELGHHRLVIDPAADNHRAIQAYRKVGFRPVGVMRQYERGPDGTWHDGLLMEMLADAGPA